MPKGVILPFFGGPHIELLARRARPGWVGILIGCFLMEACSLQSPPASEAQSNLLGMTKNQISSCLGDPTQKTDEVWS
jgi:hypothetical protein